MSSTKKIINLLTLITLFAYASGVRSSIIFQENKKTHLRWTISVPKNRVLIKRTGNKVFIKTLDSSLFKKISKDIGKFKRETEYIKDIRPGSPGGKRGVFSFSIELVDGNIEFFSFYRDGDKKYIVDFWRESDEITEKKSSIEKAPLKIPPPSTPKAISAPPAPRTAPKPPPAAALKKQKRKEKTYRDYRYGASFYWNYRPLGLESPKMVDLRSKTVEYFYPIKDRNYEKNEKEAHMQLSINMYRKKKWGLMHKSIRLYREKYGAKSNFEINEYLKANAIIKDNFSKGNLSVSKMAINMLTNLESKSRNYSLKTSILKYLMQYYMDSREYISSLKIAKRIYAMSIEKGDVKEAKLSAENILFNLSNLNQTDKIKNILKEKEMLKVLPANTVLVYKVYSYMKTGNSKEVIKIYEKNKKSLAKPIHQSILFNAAESYFREAMFEKSLNLFDDFIKSHSYHTYASKARIRLGLIYEITEKNEKEAEALYKNAINRSQSIKDSLEARIRYVALKNIRKINPSEKDKEEKVFAELSGEDKKNLDINIKKILWLTRLRMFISEKKYYDALAYLKAIPLGSLRPVEKRVFESDGAEIVYGIIEKNYKNSKYSKIIKMWEIYKNKYIRKVANDPVMNFIVGKSYLKIGLYDPFDEICKNFKKLESTPLKTFPVWIKRDNYGSHSIMLGELLVERNLQLNNLDLAQQAIDKITVKDEAYRKENYYKGIIDYRKKRYAESEKKFELFLSGEENKNILDLKETSELINAYTESVYRQKKYKKFKKVAKAILDDTREHDGSKKFIGKTKERVSYLLIETMFSEKRGIYSENLEKEIFNFKENYKESSYMGRVDYILGIYYIKMNKTEKGKDIFKKMLSRKDVSGSIKGLVRSNLAMLSIKEKNL